jgi:hypothetical protein
VKLGVSPRVAVAAHMARAATAEGDS